MRAQDDNAPSVTLSLSKGDHATNKGDDATNPEGRNP